MTPRPAQIGSIPPICQKTISFYPANALGSTPLIRQPTITPGPAQIGSTPPANLPQQSFNAYTNLYTQIPPIRIPNKILPITIVAQFVQI